MRRSEWIGARRWAGRPPEGPDDRADADLMARVDRERLVLATRVSGLGIWDFDIATGALYCDERWYRILGRDPATPVRTISAFKAWIHPDDVGKATDVNLASLGDLLAAGRDYDIVFRIVRPSGEIRWLHSAACLIADGAGIPRRAVGVVADITDERKAKETLQQSYDSVVEAKAQAESAVRLYKAQAESMPNQVWTARPDGYLDWFNQHAYAYAGRAEGDLDAMQWASIVHPDDLAHALATWQDALAIGEAPPTEFRLRRHDGEYRWHISRFVPIRNLAGEIERWIGSNTDIHDQKSAETALSLLNSELESIVRERTDELLRTRETLQRQERMDTLSTLAGGFAHDFNNLLQVIGTTLSLIRLSVPLDEVMARRVQTAKNAVLRGGELASQLLAAGRRQSLRPLPLDIGAEIRGMEDLLRSTLGEGIELSVKVPPDLWSALLDGASLELALLNLTINARDAMHGHGSLTLIARNVHLSEAETGADGGAAPGDFVKLTIADTGVGMAPDVAQRVFEPFFTTKAIGKGTGLGLSMVHGYVKQSGGHITVDSALGVGTTFTLFLPRAPQSAAPVELPHAVGGTEHILVVEDNDGVRDTTVAMLTEMGYTVTSSADAHTALTILRSDPSIDLLFTDVVVPGTMRTADLTRAIEVERPGLPILYTSGYTTSAFIRELQDNPAIHFISKPYARQQLAAMLREVFRRAAATRSDRPRDAGE